MRWKKSVMGFTTLGCSFFVDLAIANGGGDDRGQKGGKETEKPTTAMAHEKRY
jgi:hypothetical protein